MTASLHIFLQNLLKGKASPCISQEMELFKCSTDLVAIVQRNNVALEILKWKKKPEKTERWNEYNSYAYKSLNADVAQNYKPTAQYSCILK